MRIDHTVFLAVLIGVALASAGCDTVYSERFVVSNEAGGSSPVLALFKDFAAAHGYSLQQVQRNAPTNSSVSMDWVRQEVPPGAGEVWVASQAYHPALLCFIFGQEATIKIQELSGPTPSRAYKAYTQQIHQQLLQQFGAGRIKMLE